MLTPSKIGFLFEDFIRDILKKTNLEFYDEKNIRKSYPEITAIDHIIIHNNEILCFQDKWKKSKDTPKDIHHFHCCIEKIKNISNKNCYGIYLSKIELSKNAKKCADEYNITSIYDNNPENIKKLLIDYFYDNHNIYLFDKENDIIMR